MTEPSNILPEFYADSVLFQSPSPSELPMPVFESDPPIEQKETGQQDNIKSETTENKSI